MKIGDLGEFGLIDRIARLLPHPPANVVVGIGDDVAVLKTSGTEYLLATCDIQVEDVHFLRRNTTPHQLGRKVVAVNVSDIAAMGGTPLWALVSLALPDDTDVSFVEGLYSGMREQSASAGAAIVGGNLSGSSGKMAIDLFLLGRVLPEHLMLRSGARDGDLILVTGALGESRAGLELTRFPNLMVSKESRQRGLQRHLTPEPRLAEGQVLGRSGKVHAMLDVSDGLLGDLGHICRAGGVGAEIWIKDLPVASSCREVARASGQDPVDWALSGGEDYELLLTAGEASVSEIQSMLREETGIPCHVIGRVLGGCREIRIVSPEGGESLYALDKLGWDHFKKRRDPLGPAQSDS